MVQTWAMFPTTSAPLPLPRTRWCRETTIWSPAVDELLGLEAQRVERLHIGVEQLLDALFAVASLRPVGGAFAVAELKSGARRSRKASTPPSLKAS